MKNIEKLASEHVESFGEVMPGVKFGYHFVREYTFKYYYDFTLVPTGNNKLADGVGGPLGFTIDKLTNNVETLSAGMLAELNQRESELITISERLLDIDERDKEIIRLKSYFNLKSTDLLTIKKLLMESEIDKRKILTLINDWQIVTSKA